MTKSASLVHEISIDAPVARVVECLTTEAGLRGWNTGRASGSGQVGGAWRLDYGNGVVFTWKVEAASPDRIAWLCTAGPGDSVGTRAEYRLSARPDGKTRVEFAHDGWPHTEGAFAKCNTLWGALLHHLARYAETGRADPAHC